MLYQGSPVPKGCFEVRSDGDIFFGLFHRPIDWGEKTFTIWDAKGSML